MDARRRRRQIPGLRPAAGAENDVLEDDESLFHRHRSRGHVRHTGEGTKWAVKNTFELKNAQDVLIEGNVFENIWVADQTGYPIVFTPRNQGGRAPWAIIQRITFSNNLIRHAAGGVNILGIDDLAPSQRTNNVTVRHNVFDDITAATWGAGSRPIIIGDGPDIVTVDHNTIVTTDRAYLALWRHLDDADSGDQRAHHEQHGGAQHLRHRGVELQLRADRDQRLSARRRSSRRTSSRADRRPAIRPATSFRRSRRGRPASSTLPPATIA